MRVLQVPTVTTFYLGTPGNSAQAHFLRGMPVLISYAASRPWIDDYSPSFGPLLIDSGAFSELNSGVKVDLAEYADWCAQYPSSVPCAGLDDIGGDWRRSLANYAAFPRGFPTFHETDPLGLLDDLVAMARERGGWLGIGLLPPRIGRARWLREMLDRIPGDLHVHGWALGAYLELGFASVDSTNWLRDAGKVKNFAPWLTPTECVEIVVERYRRADRYEAIAHQASPGLFPPQGERPRHPCGCYADEPMPERCPHVEEP